MAQHGIEPSKIRQRILQARTWQEHARLVFDVLHSPAKDDIQTLAAFYRAEVALKNAPLLIRWAYANASIEIKAYHISNRSAEYGIRYEDFWDEPQVFEELRRIVKESPRNPIGHMSLASAYYWGLIDHEIHKYAHVTEERQTTIRIGGREVPVRARSIRNPERRRRYLYYRDRVRELDPSNPYLSYWHAMNLYYRKPLEQRSREEIAREGLKKSLEAYENGFSRFSPIVALGSVIYFAWKANRLEEMKRWGETLKSWIAQNRQSPYVAWLRDIYAPSCQYIRDITS